MEIWRDISRFPPASGEWQILSSGKVISTGEQNVKNLALRWFLTQKKLISTPASKYFLPAICAPEISSITHKSFLKRFRVFFYIFGFYLAIFIAMALVSDQPQRFYKPIALMLLGILYFYIEFQIALRPYTNISERALFYNWLFARNNTHLNFAFLALFAVGLGQFLFHHYVGNLETLVIGYGTYFPAIEEGEIWRYAVGPFIHSGAIHWIVNAFFLIYVIKMIGDLANKNLFLLYLASLPATAIAVHIFATLTSSPMEALVGISGGIYFLFGWLLIITHNKRQFFPKHFSTSLALIVAANLLLPELLSYNSSFTAHISGFLLGAFAGLLGLASNFQQVDRTTSH